jgi:hypothetical protein
MALAIRIDSLIRAGEIADYAEAARLGYVTRARMSQIMGLLNLAPDLQEAILHLPRVLTGRDSITEREIRPLVRNESWARQRRVWQTEFQE